MGLVCVLCWTVIVINLNDRLSSLSRRVFELESRIGRPCHSDPRDYDRDSPRVDL